MSYGGLSLRDLEYLDAVARQRHFGRAAAECGVSQPALSVQIKKLEAIIGVTVFERSPRRVLLTAKGEEVLVRTRNILREARALLNEGRQRPPLAGPLRIGALPTLGPYLLPSLIEPFRHEWPEVDLLISEDLTDTLLKAIAALNLSPMQTLFLLIGFYIVVGFFIETLSLMIITIPLVAPLVISLGFDPVWFGILLIVLIEMALITPPVGLNLYVVQGARKRGRLGDVMMGAIPYVFIMLLMVVLLVAFPGIALFFAPA